MFKHMSAPLCVALVALTASLASASSASAAANFGAVTISNTSDVTLNYTVTWGNDRSHQFSVAPGETTSHWMTLNEDGTVPTPVIAFDAVAGDDEVTVVEYEVTAYAVNDPSRGKPYTFAFSSNGVTIDLYAG